MIVSFNARMFLRGFSVLKTHERHQVDKECIIGG